MSWEWKIARYELNAINLYRKSTRVLEKTPVLNRGWLFLYPELTSLVNCNRKYAVLSLEKIIYTDIYCGQLSPLRRIANKMLLPFRIGTGVVFFQIANIIWN